MSYRVKCGELTDHLDLNELPVCQNGTENQQSDEWDPAIEQKMDVLTDVALSKGKVYRLRSPNIKYLVSLSTYDSSNPTKGWDFPDMFSTDHEYGRVSHDQDLSLDGDDHTTSSATINELPCICKKENRSWQTTLPHDILSVISDLLPLSDFINFRGVCRHWRSAPSCRSNITQLSKKEPWCILYDCDTRDKDICHFYQCDDRRSCSVKLPGLRGAKCFVSKHGWLFIHRDNDYLFFNPLTLEEIFLPKYPAKSFESPTCQVGTFKSSPSSQDCVAVLLNLRDSSTIKITSCCLTANKWVVNMFKVYMPCHIHSSVPWNSVLLPSPRCVCIATKHDMLQFLNRPNRGNYAKRIISIIVCYATHYLIFYFSTKRCEVERMRPLESHRIYDEFMTCNWYSKLKEVHSDDWICKFGKEFTFSFCLFNDCKRFDEKHAYNDSLEGKCVFVDDRPTIPNVPVIKAVWLFNFEILSKLAVDGSAYAHQQSYALKGLTIA